MKWRWLYVLVPVALLGVLITWRLSQKRAEAAENAKATAARKNAPASVQTATAKRQDIVRTFAAVGSVEAPVAVDVAAKVTGRLTYLGAREGDRVSAGQVLARLDPAEVEALVRQKQAALAQARSRLAEARLSQGANNVTLTSEVQKQRAAVATAQAQDRQAQADYDARIAAAQAAVTDAQGKVDAANAQIARADAAVASARADLKNAKTELNRQEMLLKEGAVAQQVVDNARTAAEVREAALNQAQQDRAAAAAARDSAVAQRKAAERQVEVVRNQARATLASASAGVAQARATLSAAQANTGRAPAYEENLAALRAAVDAAAADVRATEAQLADTTLRAPIDGVVTAKSLDPGAVATVNQAILSVQDIRSVWVSVSVPEEVSRALYQGQTAQVAFDALPGGAPRTGKIAQVLPAADPQSRQFTVRIRLENPGYRLRPGMFGRVTFETGRERDALVVPREAIKRDGEGEDAPATVTVVGADGKAQVRDVKIGASDDRVVAVTSGLQEGDQVVILSAGAVRDGQPVKTGSGRASSSTPPSPTRSQAGSLGEGGRGGEGGPRAGAATEGQARR
jgi:multidrug efflux pump subunit AcrA (membrane-fusion protein)